MLQPNQDPSLLQDADFLCEEKQIDDCMWFVLTNVVGPVSVFADELNFLEDEPINKVHPEEYVSLKATEKLYDLIYKYESDWQTRVPEPM